MDKKRVWLISIVVLLLFHVVDIISTITGLYFPGTSESNPLLVLWLNNFGYMGFIVDIFGFLAVICLIFFIAEIFEGLYNKFTGRQLSFKVYCSYFVTVVIGIILLKIFAIVNNILIILININ